MFSLKHGKKKGLSDTIVASRISRRLFIRSVGLGSMGIGLHLAGITQGNNPFPKFVKLLPRHPEQRIPIPKRYYGHDAVIDRYGVIAPWYHRPNGQCDFRIRIAAETLKRYPWTTTKNAIASYPHYVFSSRWEISSDGTITPKKSDSDWMNGDFGQRCMSILHGMVEYYRYSGDPGAIAHLTYMGDYLINYCLTPEDHSWPNFPISVPTKGKAYGKADPNGMIQLDICASIGEGLLRAYQITKNQRWFDAASHWGNLFAENCDMNVNAAPWPRYANSECISTRWKDEPMGNLQTSGVVNVLAFLDELIRLGYSGKDQQIVNARNAGIRYLRDQLLPKWSLDHTWGLYYWDWLQPVQGITSAYVADYILKNKELFPNWRNDIRNILMLFLNRTSANPESGSDVYNGAWAYPEASNCCGRSLWYAPLTVGTVMARYGVVADDALMRELGYRQLVLQTYDGHESGVTEDNIDGGVIVNNSWFNIAHPLPLLWVLQAISWLPEELGPSRENHLIRSSAVVDSIVYSKGDITYTTFDSPPETIDVFRLSYVPKEISADGQPLSQLRKLERNGYVIKKLPDGDSIVSIRHDGKKNIFLSGADPQTELINRDLMYNGAWTEDKDDSSSSGSIFWTDNKDASVSSVFTGNQVRLTGRADQFGGYADIFIDNIKQNVFIDFWNPAVRGQQILYYRNGLEPGEHTLKIIARGTGNPYSQGSRIYIDTLQYSSESGIHNYPSGTGPTGPQRMIFGYTKRDDYKDTKGHLWRPAMEIVSRLGKTLDTVENYWWVNESKGTIRGTKDPELYHYGFHSSDFWVNITVGPGNYDVRLKFAVTSHISRQQSGFDIIINEKTAVHDFNVAATAGGLNKAADLVFKNIAPLDGVIKIRFKGLPYPDVDLTKTGEAFVQALEIGHNLIGKGAMPVSNS
jgi:hypothetical protein